MSSIVQSSIKVVAGIIWNVDKSQLLISKRPLNKHKGGYWEFPGGKVESQETFEDALKRELYEELSLTFGCSRFFQAIDYEYPDKRVSISFYHVFDLGDTISPNENQLFRWVSVDHLKDYTFPEANKPVIDALLQGQ